MQLAPALRRDAPRRVIDLADLPIAVAPDGNPVAVYLALPAKDEARLITSAIKPGSSVLELGCGAGRISRELASRGYRVVAVDQSPDMLQHVPGPGITAVLADIETLTLNETFNAVLLTSYLVNTADRDLRSRFLATCRRYLSNNGVVVIQRVDPQIVWHINASSSYGPVRVRLLAAQTFKSFVKAFLEYRVGAHKFQQRIHIEILDDDAFEKMLATVGFRLDRWLDDACTWAVVRARS